MRRLSVVIGDPAARASGGGPEASGHRSRGSLKRRTHVGRAGGSMAAMGLTHKLIKKHLVEGRMVPGEEIALAMDQALLQDATGTLAWLEVEQMGVGRVRGAPATGAGGVGGGAAGGGRPVPSSHAAGRPRRPRRNAPGVVLREGCDP